MRLVIIAALIAIMGIPAEAQTLEEAHSIIADEMRDPESTRFRNTWIVERFSEDSGVSVCGEFNTKNAMGGYEGYMPFYAMVITKSNVKRAVVVTQKLASSEFILKKCTKP